VYPIVENGGAPREIPARGPLAPLLWAPGDWLYVQHIGAYTQIPTRVSRLHLTDGRLEPQHELTPSDTLGVTAIPKVMGASDTEPVVFTSGGVLRELLVAEPTSR